MMFSGYRTAEGLINAPGSGWYATGDLGEILPDEQLRLVGRAKDMIIRSGHNIDPLMIEDVVCRHRGIALAAAVGMPDAFAGELPIVYAVRRADAMVDEEELGAFVAEHIAEPAARPKRVIFVEMLPLTPVGKVARYRLRQEAVVMRMTELLREIDGILEITCGDVASRRVTLAWVVEPDSAVRDVVAAIAEPLGLTIIHA
jgi:fatty-acyl-CoA synthase